MTTTPRTSLVRRTVAAMTIAGALVAGSATPAFARDNAPAPSDVTIGGLPCRIPGTDVTVQDGTYYWVRQPDGTMKRFQCKNGVGTESSVRSIWF